MQNIKVKYVKKNHKITAKHKCKICIHKKTYKIQMHNAK